VTRKRTNKPSRSAVRNAKAAIRHEFESCGILGDRHDNVDAAVDLILEVARLAPLGLSIAERLDKPTTQKSLRRVADLSQQLVECIESLPRNTLSELAIGIRHEGSVFGVKPLSLPPRGRILGDLKDLAYAASLGSRRSRGNPGNFVAREITRVVAVCYERLTGKAPSPGYNDYDERRSDFEILLGNVFSIVHIDANPERQAKSLAKQRRLRWIRSAGIPEKQARSLAKRRMSKTRSLAIRLLGTQSIET
jgi:hypothetical protein